MDVFIFTTFLSSVETVIFIPKYYVSYIFVQDGKYGSGKTLILAHVIHYAYLSNWLIVHVPRSIY